MGWFQNWLSMIRAATAEGRRFSRVRVVSVPLTGYSRFGVFCSQYTNEAGEQIRYLTRDQARDLPGYDYWLFSAELNLAQPQEIELYGGIFDQMAGVASYGRAARAIVTRVIDDLAPEAPEDGS